MTAARSATETVAFVDNYCAAYRDQFQDVRSFDHFTRLQLGLISDVARKSLPAIARVTGANPQALHHFVANADWDVTHLRQRRLQRTRQALGGRLQRNFSFFVVYGEIFAGRTPGATELTFSVFAGYKKSDNPLLHLLRFQDY